MDTQLLERSVDLLRLADLVTPMAVRAGATLRLPDHIAAGHRSTEALAEVTGCHPRPLGKLLRHLAAIGILRADGEDAFTVGELGELLSAQHEHLGIRAFLDVENVVGRAELGMVELGHTLRTARPAFEARHGRTFWEDLGSGSCSEGIESLANAPARFDAELLVESFDWSGRRSFVDVGGNGGAITAALLTAHPHLEATLLDLPCFASLAEKNLADAGLADRCTVVAGSFFEPLPTGADVYLLSAILADWDDDDAIAILRRCAEAADPDGVVLLAEVHLTAANPDPVRQTADALRLEASMTHPDRTVDDLERLARSAGLVVSWRGPVTPVRSLLGLRPSRTGRGEG